MPKINIQDDELPDLSAWKQKFADLRNERDMLASQIRDLEKSYAVSEAKADRLGHENERLTAQLDAVKAQATEWRTLISGIAQMIIPVMKGGDQPNKREPLPFAPMLGSPPRQAIGDGIAAILRREPRDDDKDTPPSAS